MNIDPKSETQKANKTLLDFKIEIAKESGLDKWPDWDSVPYGKWYVVSNLLDRAAERYISVVESDFKELHDDYEALSSNYKLAQDRIIDLQSENQRLTEENAKQYEKGYSDGRNGLLNNDLQEKVERLTKINEELVKALNIIPPEKFILLADWLDLVDKKGSYAGDEVQQDLRRFAVQVKDALEKSKPLNHEQS